MIKFCYQRAALLWTFIDLWVKRDNFIAKMEKSSGIDHVSFNIIKKCFGVLCKPLICLFQLSLKKWAFLDDLKIAKVTSIYKARDSSDASNCRPMSVLPCFTLPLQVFTLFWKTVWFSKWIFQEECYLLIYLFQTLSYIVILLKKGQLTPGVFID